MESNGEPPTCSNGLSGSSGVRGSLNMLAPFFGSRGPLRTGEGLPMAINIHDDSMSLEINGATVNAAIRLGNLWRVTGWPRLLTRDEAITTLTLAERLLSERSADASSMTAWGE